MPAPADGVLDLFAVPGPARLLPGSRRQEYVAGDLLLTPVRDARVPEWLSPTLARLAVTLDERPDRRRRDLRIAMPVPARDGSWVVQGWAAHRFERGSVACHDIPVVVAAGQVLHAQLAVAFPERPPSLALADLHQDRAETLAFGPAYPLLAAALGRSGAGVVRRVEPYLEDRPVGPDQLVHLGLASGLLLDARGAPVVVDLEPAWRPARWAEALAVVEGVLGGDVGLDVLDRWSTGSHRQAMLRALVYRALSDPSDQPLRYRTLLDVVAPEIH